MRRVREACHRPMERERSSIKGSPDGARAFRSVLPPYAYLSKSSIHWGIRLIVIMKIENKTKVATLLNSHLIIFRSSSETQPILHSVFSTFTSILYSPACLWSQPPDQTSFTEACLRNTLILSPPNFSRTTPGRPSTHLRHPTTRNREYQLISRTTPRLLLPPQLPIKDPLASPALLRCPAPDCCCSLWPRFASRLTVTC